MPSTIAAFLGVSLRLQRRRIESHARTQIKPLIGDKISSEIKNLGAQHALERQKNACLLCGLSEGVSAANVKIDAGL